MKRILLFFLLVISVHAQSQKTVTPNWVKSVARDTATALRAEIALKMNSSAFADSFDNRFSATSIAAIKEVAEYGRVIADSSILLYSGGVWSIFDLSEALSATANNAINITYPDANTISFNDTNVLLLDPLTLEINGSNQLTVIGGTGGSVGNADSLGGKPASEYLVKNDSTAQRTFSDLKYVDKASTQTITGEKTFSNSKTVFGTTTNDSVGVRGRINVGRKITVGSGNNLLSFDNATLLSGGAFPEFNLKLNDPTLSPYQMSLKFDYLGMLTLVGTGIYTGLPSGNLSYNGGTVNSSDLNWLLERDYAIYSMNGLRTDGDIHVDSGDIYVNGDINVIGNYYRNGVPITASGSVGNADSLGALPASAYVTKSAIDGWSTNLYTGSANVMRLGKSYNDKRFNNGAYSDVWNIDYVVPPYNLSASWLFPIEHRTDYYNDTLQTVSGVANLLKIDGTGTPIWKSSTVTIAGQETQVNIGDLPDSTTLNYSASSTIGNNVILSEENMTASETRYPMQIKGYNFRLGTNNNYILPKLYSYYSDLSTGNIEDGYHFYGEGDYPSYFGGDLRISGAILVDSSTSRVYINPNNNYGLQISRPNDDVGMKIKINNQKTGWIVFSNEDGSDVGEIEFDTDGTTKTFEIGTNTDYDVILRSNKNNTVIVTDTNVTIDGYLKVDSVIVGNSTVKIYPDSITIGGTRVAKITEAGALDTTIVNNLIEANEDTSGSAIIGTTATLDSIITDYWNNNLGSGTTFDSTYAYQRIVALENDVSALQDTIAYFTNAITSILAALDTCGCSAVVEDNTPPLAPTSYVAIGGTSQTQYVTTWTDPVDADLSKIYWYEGSANDSTTLALVDSINAGVQTYTRTGRTANTTYWSAVKAVDDSGNVSWFSNIDSATTQSTGGASPIATLDFEEGDLSEWSSTSGANLSASSTVAHTGTYSMRVGTNSYGNYNFGDKDSIYVTFWVYFPSTSSQSATTNYISLFDDGDGDKTAFGTSNFSTTWDQWAIGQSSGDMNYDPTGFSQNTWHKVKLFYKRGTGANAVHTAWINDTLLWTTTTGTANDPAYYLRLGSQVATITNWFYIDDIKLYNSNPGTQD